MPIVIGKSVNFLLTQFTPKAGQIYPQGANLPTVKNPWSKRTRKVANVLVQPKPAQSLQNNAGFSRETSIL